MTQPAITRPPGPRFGVSLTVLLLGLGAAIVGIVMLVSAFWSIIDGPSYAVPGTLRVHLGSGNYTIYEYDRFGTFRSPPLVDTAAVTVTAPGGGRVPVSSTLLGGSNETISSGGQSYGSVVRFTAPSDGTYTIRVRTTAPTRIRIEHPIVDIASDNAGWVLLIVIGGIVTIVGFVMVVVGLVRRGSAKRRAAAVPVAAAVPGAPTAWPPSTTAPPVPASPAAAPIEPAAPTVAPAGWFPDPSGTHRLRYWDGQTWTEHVAE